MNEVQNIDNQVVKYNDGEIELGVQFGLLKNN